MTYRLKGIADALSALTYREMDELSDFLTEAILAVLDGVRDHEVKDAITKDYIASLLLSWADSEDDE